MPELHVGPGSLRPHARSGVNPFVGVESLTAVEGTEGFYINSNMDIYIYIYVSRNKV